MRHRSSYGPASRCVPRPGQRLAATPDGLQYEAMSGKSDDAFVKTGETAILAETDTWVFDLDNTLYSASDHVFVQVSNRIQSYIADFLGIHSDEAYRLQKRYFQDYGTSLRGMMVVHEMDPGPFLDYVHDIDLSPIGPHPELDQVLSQLPGRKLIFTNASAEHADRILRRLGVDHHFAAIFDLAAAHYVPKPQIEAYETFVARFGLNCSRCVMIDDIARNLSPAARLGMTTVWLRNETEWGGSGREDGHIHFVAEDLVDWLGHALGEG